MKFCESCGAKIETPAPDISTGVPAAMLPEEPAMKTRSAASGKPETIPTAVKTTRVDHGAGSSKKPLPQQTMIIAGVVVLALLAAAIYFVVLPMLSGSANSVPGTGNLPVVPGSPGTPGTSVAQSGATPTVEVTLTSGPTQVPPANRVVIVDAERDSITSVITVTFKGGAGQNGVKDIFVRLTRSDGQVLTKTFRPETVGSGVTFQGTIKTDRIEVTSNFYTGEQYKILDQIFEYKKRN
jgi:hypothetical protein